MSDTVVTVEVWGFFFSITDGFFSSLGYLGYTSGFSLSCMVFFLGVVSSASLKLKWMDELTMCMLRLKESLKSEKYIANSAVSISPLKTV